MVVTGQGPSSICDGLYPTTVKEGWLTATSNEPGHLHLPGLFLVVLVVCMKHCGGSPNCLVLCECWLELKLCIVSMLPFKVPLLHEDVQTFISV